jgi:hypothetical protein
MQVYRGRRVDRMSAYKYTGDALWMERLEGANMYIPPIHGMEKMLKF